MGRWLLGAAGPLGYEFATRWWLRSTLVTWWYHVYGVSLSKHGSWSRKLRPLGPPTTQITAIVSIPTE